MTKPIESYDQLIERFTKRTAQLSARAAEVKEAHDEYHRIQKDLTRLEGSLQAIEYVAFGKMPAMVIMTSLKITNLNGESKERIIKRIEELTILWEVR